MKANTVENILIYTGLTAAIVTISLMISFPFIYNAVVDDVLILGEDKPVMEPFIDPPIPIYMMFYMFNVTNPMDVLYYRAKPELQEVGPYVYEETRHKFNDSFQDGGNTYSYNNLFNYRFSREQTDDNLDESDVITTLNIVLVSMAHLLQNESYIKYLWPQMEASMDVFITANVSDILFSGWELPYLNFNFNESNIPGLENIEVEGYLSDILSELSDNNQTSFGDVIDSNKIGYFTLANYTYDGYYTVYTGQDNMDDYVNVKLWNNEPSLHWWGDDDSCNAILGTDGTQYPPRAITEDSTVYIFVTQLCRSLYLKHDVTMDFRGITVLRFRPPKEMLESPYINPDNMCYCEAGTLGCLPSGCLELSPCLGGLPVIASTPHFYNGDPDLPSLYEGISPDRDLHDTILDLETTFGVPVSAHKRIQVNLPLKAYGNLTSFMIFNDMTIFPVLWADETATLSDDQSDAMKNLLVNPYIIWYVVVGVVFVVGAGCLVYGGRKRYLRKHAPVV